MSSLAAARADNFYFPPDWRPEYGSISKFQGSKGANQYEQYGIIRFELPFDAWCLNCHRHISKGTRFNAKKEQDGNYLSTKIWAFHTKCASCDQKFIIKTNPKDRTYDFVEGLRRMEQEFTPDFDDSIIAATTDEQRALLSSNPIAKLEHDADDRRKVLTVHERLSALSEIKEEQFLDDYGSNSKLRQSLRGKKKKDRSLLREGQKYGLSIPLVESDPKDAITAKLAIQRREINSKSALSAIDPKVEWIQSSSIFSTRKSSDSGSKKSSQQVSSGDGGSKISMHDRHKKDLSASGSSVMSKLRVKRATLRDESSSNIGLPSTTVKKPKTVPSVRTKSPETGSEILSSLLSGYTSD